MRHGSPPGDQPAQPVDRAPDDTLPDSPQTARIPKGSPSSGTGALLRGLTSITRRRQRQCLLCAKTRSVATQPPSRGHICDASRRARLLRLWGFTGFYFSIGYGFILLIAFIVFIPRCCQTCCQNFLADCCFFSRTGVGLQSAARKTCGIRRV